MTEPACLDEGCRKRKEPKVRIKAYLFGEISRMTCENCWRTWERQSDGTWVLVDMDF